MKKLLGIIILALLFIGYENDESNMKEEMLVKSSDVMSVQDNNSYDQNDLVYRDYGTGIKLSTASTVIIPQLDLNLSEETAIVYALDLENHKLYQIGAYQPMRDVSYSPVSDGTYLIIAELSNGEIVDLTLQAMIETSFSEESTDGFILLN